MRQVSETSLALSVKVRARPGWRGAAWFPEILRPRWAEMLRVFELFQPCFSGFLVRTPPSTFHQLLATKRVVDPLECVEANFWKPVLLVS